MFDTIERASVPTPDYTLGLRRAPYRDLTLFLGQPDSRDTRKFALSKPKDEIRYVEAKNAKFLVDPQGISNALMMGLVWGSLGMTIEKMARDFGVTESTAKTQRTTLYRKLGTSTMGHAVRVAFDENIFTTTSTSDHRNLEVTPRELQVLDTLSMGNTIEEVGKQLHISASTVKTHTQSLFDKNYAANCAHAVLMGHLSGQLPLVR